MTSHPGSLPSRTGRYCRRMPPGNDKSTAWHPPRPRGCCHLVSERAVVERLHGLRPDTRQQERVHSALATPFARPRRTRPRPSGGRPDLRNRPHRDPPLVAHRGRKRRRSRGISLRLSVLLPSPPHQPSAGQARGSDAYRPLRLSRVKLPKGWTADCRSGPKGR